jgi:PilZ domain
VGETKAIRVTFPSGRELLNAYWGLLANGGLVLQEHHAQGRGLHEGDAVQLEVVIESSQQEYKLAGHVVRRPPAQSGGRERVVIAFSPGEPHDLLLSAAWAETENVPARRQRRFPIEANVKFRSPTAEERAARLVNLSYGGCCVRIQGEGHHPPVAVGDPVYLVGDGMEVSGVVRWSRAGCRGIEFNGVDSEVVEKFVRTFL